MVDLADFLRKKGFRIFSIPKDRPLITIDQMHTLAKTFAERLFNNPKMSSILKNSGLIFQFVFFDEHWEDEEPTITVVCKPDELEFHIGKTDIKPILIMKMHGDVAHRFWKRKLNLLRAVAQGQIKVKGPLHRALKLLPFARIGFDIYDQVLEDLGLTELLHYP